MKKLIFTVILLGSFVRAYANSNLMVDNCTHSSGVSRDQKTTDPQVSSVANTLIGQADSLANQYNIIKKPGNNSQVVQ